MPSTGSACAARSPSTSRSVKVRIGRYAAARSSSVHAATCSSGRQRAGSRVWRERPQLGLRVGRAELARRAAGACARCRRAPGSGAGVDRRRSRARTARPGRWPPTGSRPRSARPALVRGVTTSTRCGCDRPARPAPVKRRGARATPLAWRASRTARAAAACAASSASSRGAVVARRCSAGLASMVSARRPPRANSNPSPLLAPEQVLALLGRQLERHRRPRRPWSRPASAAASWPR